MERDFSNVFLYIQNTLKNRQYIEFCRYIDYIESIFDTRILQRELESILHCSSGQNNLWKELVVRLALGFLYNDLDQIVWADNYSKESVEIKAPVIIIAGSCNEYNENAVTIHKPEIIRYFHKYTGTIIGGGTICGVSGLVGEIQDIYPEKITTIGYIPTDVDPSILDLRYTYHVFSSGRDFSILEAFQYWIDILASGVLSEDISLIGVYGGEISCVEYRLALLFGVGISLLGDSNCEITFSKRK